jgi:uroporphyrinogen-III synthase
MVQTIPPTVLLTRPRAASERFAAELRLPVIISPLMETIWLDAPPLESMPDAVVFTSENGVTGFVRCQKWRGRAYCVGDRTAQAAQGAGFEALSARGDLDDLKDLLAAHADGEQLVHARGLHVAGDLGEIATPLMTYEQRPLGLTDEAHKLLSGLNKVIVPIFSPRSAMLFAEELTEADCAPLVIIGLSAAVARACNDAGLSVFNVADAPDGAAMLHAIEIASM